ncbi:MAG: hypothetical protein PHV34_08790 [Verrucomicrobiae bacterium]|nr:hypothetical protein [Verrucomicrobiae bacterium]
MTNKVIAADSNGSTSAPATAPADGGSNQRKEQQVVDGATAVIGKMIRKGQRRHPLPLLNFDAFQVSNGLAGEAIEFVARSCGGNPPTREEAEEFVAGARERLASLPIELRRGHRHNSRSFYFTFVKSAFDKAGREDIPAEAQEKFRSIIDRVYEECGSREAPPQPAEAVTTASDESLEA